MPKMMKENRKKVEKVQKKNHPLLARILPQTSRNFFNKVAVILVFYNRQNRDKKSNRPIKNIDMRQNSAQNLNDY